MTAVDAGGAADDESVAPPDDVAATEVADTPVEPAVDDPTPTAGGSAATDENDAAGTAEDGAADSEASDAAADAPVVNVAIAAARDQLDAADDPVGAAAEMIVALAAERAEYLDAAQRSRADLDNLRKRTERDRVVIVERAEERLVTQLLEVLDACDLAATHHPDEVAPIRSKLLATLTSAGLTVVAEVEAPFDPNHHQAVETESGDVESDIVAAVHRPGYLWHGRLLRPALVKVRQPE